MIYEADRLEINRNDDEDWLHGAYAVPQLCRVTIET
jgi:hypothetical protein